jgi:hypothetical protein
MQNNNSESPSPSDKPKPADPFANLESLRLSQDFAAAANVKPVFTTIAVRKPNRHEFVRVRRGEESRFTTGTFTQKDSRETYMVAPDLWSMMPGEIQPTLLVVAMSRQSAVPFVWALTLPGPDGRPNRWHESGIEAARLAEESWVRVVADMSAGFYVPYAAQGELPEPAWPDMSLEELLRLAFGQRFIRDVNHPVLRQLRGEV